MSIRTWCRQFVVQLCGFCLLFEMNTTREAWAESQTVVQAEETQAGVSTAAADVKEKIFRRDLNRAYMNCLLQIDEDLAALADNPKARTSEAQAKRDFCDKRKKDCLGTNHDELNCKIFLEDYSGDVE